MIHLSSETEDFLEQLYARQVEGETAPLPTPHDRVIGELLRLGFLHVEGKALPLTKEGLRAAELAVRRHRLAERLMHDVLNVPGTQVDSAACEFEHSLHHGVDDRICTLLGHPKTCPHGRPIPPGKCCREKNTESQAAVLPLSSMKNGERGAIAYLSSRQMDTLRKLMALGVLPGSPIVIIQTFPSVVFQVSQTQVAVDADLAGDIYVRRTE